MTAAAEEQSAYLPLDRLRALAAGSGLPELTHGSALFADISGFTALTTRLARNLGLRRGAEELPRHLDRVWLALVERVHSRGGSVISFAGDAITCWFDGDDGGRAVTCALELQEAMQQFGAVRLPDGGTVGLSLKVAVATGPVRRMVVGDPAVQLLDVIAGETLTRLAAAESVADSGEVVVDELTASNLTDRLRINGWRERFAVVAGLSGHAPAAEDVRLPVGVDVRNWLLPAVHARLEAGQGELLTELRPAVAMFVGFSGIDYDADERAGERLDEFIRHVQSSADRLGGSLLQLTIGDKGSYVYLAFGAPISNEDDSRRAVSLALDLTAQQSRFDYLQPLRIGISRGTMRTGAYGSPERRTYGVLGDETNLAARLMGQALPGQILASAFVRADSSDWFQWRELDPVKVKGRETEVQLFTVTGRAREAAEGGLSDSRTRLFGREAELANLLERAASARRGIGQTVKIVGEAGIGKTRLVAELVQSPELSDATLLNGEGESFQSDTPFRPWNRVFRNLLGLGSEAVTPERLSGALAEVAPDLLPRLPLLAPVLNMRIEDSSLTASLEGELRKDAREALLLELLRRSARSAGSRGGLLLLVLENTQWFDGLSVDLLAGASRMAVGLPMLLVMTQRPGDAGQLSATAQVLELQALPEREAQELLQALLDGSNTDAGLRTRILQQGQGNPYYLEELAGYVRLQGAAADAPEELPTSLHSLVLSRLDRLGEHEQATVKSASIIGPQFRIGWLDGYYPALGGLEQLSRSAAGLSQLDLFRLLQQEPLTFGFRQLLTREIAYASIPHATRTELHTRLARWLESEQATPSEPLLEVLALHYGLGNNMEKKSEYLKRAGVAAQESYANETALRWFGELLPLAEGAERLDLLQRQGQIQLHLGRYREAESSFQDALELARSLSDRHNEAVSMRLLGELSEKQGSYRESVSWLSRSRAVFEELGEEPELIQVLLALGGNVLWQQGEYDSARENLELALELARKHHNSRGIARTLHGLGNIELYQGRLAEARQLFEDSLQQRREIGDSLGVANALNNLGIIASSLEGPARAREYFEESLQIRREIGDLAGTAVALNNVGFMAAEMGDLQLAFELNFESLGLRREIGDRLGIAVTLNSLGYLQFRLDNASEAATHYSESLQLSFEIGNIRETAAALAGAAALVAPARPELAVRLAAVAEAQLHAIKSSMDPEVRELHDLAVGVAAAELGEVHMHELQLAAGQQELDGAVSMALRSLESFGQPASD